MKVGQTLSFQFNFSGVSGSPFATSTPVINIFNMGSTTLVANGNYTGTSSATFWTYSTTSATAWTEGAIAFNVGYPGDTNSSATTTFQSAASSTLINVVFDKTPPTLSTVTAASNDSPTTVGKIGSVVTVSFLASEFIQAPAVTIEGHSATVLSTSTLAKFWTASTTIQSGDASGALSFSITTPTDYASNATSTATWLTSGTGVSVYGSLPTVTITGSNPDSTYYLGVAYTDPGATATDAQGGTISAPTTGAIDPSTFGAQTLTYTATDAAGNAASKTRTVNVVTAGGGGISGGGGGGGGGSAPVALPNNGGSQSGAAGPSGVSASVAGLQAELKALLAQIAGLGGSTNGASSFARNLTIGSTGNDVMALQVWLNAHGYVLASSGAGSPGNETARFGGLTKAALAKFQAAVGISPAAGYFGAKTRAYLAAHQ
jgi:hypothetical protein